MVEHPHIDQPERIAEPARQLPISLARFGHARGMIVGQNDRCGIVRQRALDHLTGVHTGPVDGAVKKHLESQHPVFGVKKQTAEEFVRLMPQACLEVIAHGLRAFQRRIPPDALRQVSPRHFQHGLQLSKFGRPQAQVFAELDEITFQ